jgi:lysophospholipase L1-like esterase
MKVVEEAPGDSFEPPRYSSSQLGLMNTKIISGGFLKNLALLFISTVIALLLGEIALRLVGWSPLYVSPERDHFWKYDSLLGWAHQPGQEGIFETPQVRTFVRINQKGLRDREHSYERPNNTKRILVIGDSFAWGYGVEESERFSQLLETSLGVEIINAGVSGYSTDQELLWFRSEGVKYKPDLVVLIFTGNDIGHNQQQLVYTIYYKPQFVTEEGQLILKGYPVPRTSPRGRFVYFLSQRSATANLSIQTYFNLLSSYGKLKTNSDKVNTSISKVSSTRKPFEVTTALLAEIRNIAKSEEAKFMIVATDRWWNNPSEETYKDFIDILNAKGFLVLDVESTQGFDPEEMRIPDDGHWSRVGHEFVAKKIKNFIESNGLLSQP